ncbi:MAG TPA: Ig-like domain-containing protein [Gemmatimonadaceae bacterium]|nr:Ig-like domain-containing protein [Gemmatimonadaceae bacterium]
MRALRLASLPAFLLLHLFAAHTALAQESSPLRVIRTTPDGDVGPMTTISVTFDRPVAGSLDRSVDPKAILSVKPAVAGRIEWRDPVTIRLVPSAPLAPATSYTVTVASGFAAMDGSTLDEPYHFTFRVRGPTLLTVAPLGGHAPSGAATVAAGDSFTVVYSSPVDLARLSAAAFLEFAASCTAQRVVPLRATGQRSLGDGDGWRLRQTGSEHVGNGEDTLRRVVQLVPQAPMPRGCAGDLVAPRELAPDASRDNARWPFVTFGDLRLVKVSCAAGENETCPVGPLTVEFSTPVRGAEVKRHLRLVPETPFVVRDTADESARWTIEARLRPHTRYALVADTALRDVLGQPVRGNPALAYATSGYGSAVNYAFGSLVVERAFGTLSVQHINVDTLVALVAPVPDSLEAAVLARVGWTRDSIWTRLARGAELRRVAVRNVADRVAMTNVPLVPAGDSAGAGSLLAVKILGHAGSRQVGGDNPIALVQVTNLAVHARIGAAEGVVWVTGVSDGLPRAGANVQLHDADGRLLASAQTDARGIARLAWRARAVGDVDNEHGYQPIEGYVSATLGGDRGVAALNRWDPDLSPWRFNVGSAWGDERLPLAGAVFTERGIYRPGEHVHAKAIVRDGALGALRVPARGDSVKWIFRARDDDEGEAGVLRQRTAPLSAFGTSDDSLALPAGAPLGIYALAVQVKRQGRWRSVAQTSYRVAEYRPPEFLVDLRADSATRFPGDRFAATAQARYLFGAKMGHAAVQWMARKRALSAWEFSVPGTEDWYVGDGASWWDEEETGESSENVFDTRTDTLDALGERTLTLTLPEATRGRPTQVTVEAAVTDVNRQVVSTSTSTIVHPADFYVAAKPLGADYFWKTGVPHAIAVMAVRPTGERVAGVRVQGALVRREWHQVRRERGGVAETVGEWVSDTVARCSVTTADERQTCTFTPSAGGMYIVRFTAADAKGRKVTTSLERWAAGAGWVPWSDETQFKMEVVPDKQRYAVGDTATVLLASPFTNAEAWVTVEREGLILQRRMRLTSGSTTIKLPITEAYAPNAYVSIIVARGRSAKPGPADDPGRPTIRVGYAELRVTPEVKRLAVTLAPERAEYRPADTARVRVAVRDARGRGARSEVTLWAVDEGVLALTGYKTPDPIDLVYRARGLGMRLASNLTAVAPQVPEGVKGQREAGGGGGAEGADVLRTRFQTTAFFLGSVVTDANGDAVAVAKLPDNLTTFRLMAVAVTAGDRYGKGESSLLVTRPLLARQALPRFVRPADAFTAGAAINRRDGQAVKVKVTAEATGARLRGDGVREVTLGASRATEVRFPFTAQRTDSATFRFDVTDGTNADAVRVTIPTRPDHHPQARTIAGVLRDSATVEFPVPAGLDLARSRLSLSVGASPLATIRGIGGDLHVYPYFCTEQVISTAVPLIALYRAQQGGVTVGLSRDARGDIVRAVEMLSHRQREDGGIGYWSPTDWTTPWLSAYAGITLLDARLAGVPVDTMVLSRLAGYLQQNLHGDGTVAVTPVAYWQGQRETRLRDQVAAVDFMSRMGRPEVAAENELLRSAAQLTLEDRARLAEVFARRRETAAAHQLMEPTWALVRVEGRRAVLSDTTQAPFYFSSVMRPYARVLAATLAVDPDHALIGPLVETLAQQGRARQEWIWNTQDYASTVWALERYERYRRAAGNRSVSVSAGSRVVLQGATGTGAGRDTTVALSGLTQGNDGARTLRLSLAAGPGTGVVFYYLTMTEVPAAAPVTPVDRGIRVERWYESFDTGKPVTSVVEGDLVRVRLRVTAPTTRYFLVLDDPLPAGLEAVDLSLRTASAMPGPGARAAATAEETDHEEEDVDDSPRWGYGCWDSGWWSPFDHRELRDDRVVYSATMLWAGSYTASYIARATTAGTFIKPPAHAEEMYNPAVSGRSDGGTFEVTPKAR